MIKRTIRHRRSSKIKRIITSHIQNNLKQYIIVIIVFLIGIIAGVIFINNVSEEQSDQINEYITSFVGSLKSDSTIDEITLLKESIKKNIFLSLTIWFMGSTVIGISMVYLVIGFRGFCLGYTVSSVIATLGIGKGLIFITSTVLLQNILFIPCILGLAVSGMKLYNSIMKDRRKENIKIEIVRHTLICAMLTIALIISSFVEVYISKNLLLVFIKYI